MEYDPYVVLPEEVASSIIFYKDPEQELKADLENVRQCGWVSKIWSYCIAKYSLIQARNEFLEVNYLASRKYFRLAMCLNLDRISPPSIYYDFALFVYRQINNPRKGSEFGFIEQSLKTDSHNQSNALLDIIIHCIPFSCPEERSSYFQPPSSHKLTALVQRTLDLNKFFTTPLIPVPVEPRSLTLRSIEQILSLLEVKEFEINKILRLIREFAYQGLEERKYLASRYLIPRLINLYLGCKPYNGNPLKHPDIDEDEYTQQISNKYQLEVVFLLGSKLDRSYASPMRASNQMDLEEGVGSDALINTTGDKHGDNNEEVILTNQLDLDMLFHKDFLEYVLRSEICEKILPSISKFIHYWSYQNGNKLSFFNEVFTDVLKSGQNRKQMLELMEMYCQISDELAEIRTEFVVDRILQYTTPNIASNTCVEYLHLLQRLTTANSYAAATLLERRHEWLIEFFTHAGEMLPIVEEIVTDLLWSQEDKQALLLITETFLSVFEKPMPNIHKVRLTPICNMLQFLGLQLADKDPLIKSLPAFMKVMLDCNRQKIVQDRNSIATLTYLTELMNDDVIRHQVMTRVTQHDTFVQLLQWHYDDLSRFTHTEEGREFGFYMFNHLSLYYTLIRQCCEVEPSCLKLAVTNSTFMGLILSHVVLSPMHLEDCMGLVVDLLDLAIKSGLKEELEGFYNQYLHAIVVDRTLQNFLVAHFGVVIRLLEEALQYPKLRDNFVRSTGVNCLAMLIKRSKELDPIAIYNFDTTTLLWRLFELTIDTVEAVKVSSPAEVTWTRLLDAPESHVRTDSLIKAITAVNESLLPPTSTGARLGAKIIDAINYEKDHLDKNHDIDTPMDVEKIAEPNPTASGSAESGCQAM